MSMTAFTALSLVKKKTVFIYFYNNIIMMSSATDSVV